jgi:hypothetical protein
VSVATSPATTSSNPKPPEPSAVPTPPATLARLYWSSAGICCPARLLADRGDGLADLVVLAQDGSVQTMHSIPHACGAGSWSFVGEDPGSEGPNGDVLREDGRAVAVGGLVAYLDQRGVEVPAVIRGVSLTSFDRRRTIKVSLQRVSPYDENTLRAIVDEALRIPHGGFDASRVRAGVDWSNVEFGYRRGQWSWGV